MSESNYPYAVAWNADREVIVLTPSTMDPAELDRLASGIAALCEQIERPVTPV